MSKGLKQTLMTVAIAMIGVQAMAMAPVIKDIKSPIVGSADMVTGTGKFVYPDAMNLGALATDDVTATSALKWSYEIVGTPIYQINGKDPINSASEDPTTPPDAKVINTSVATGEVNPDAKANTITIRNKHLSPLGGPDVTANPATTGIVTAETQLVTFYCSDGNAYSSATVFFYTDNGGADRLSGTGSKWERIKTDTIAQQWDWETNGLKLGTVSKAAFNTQGGISLEVGTTGDNYGSVATPFGYLQLAKNKVYKLRARMNGSQTTTGHTPLWDISISNFDGSTKGKNAYGFSAIFFDNEGGANSVLSSTNGVWLDSYWTPAAVSTPQWDGFFAPAYNADRDALIKFRINDIPKNSSGVDNGTGADTKGGKVAIQELIIETTDLANMTVKATPINLTSLAQAGTTGGNIDAYGLVGTTVAFSSGKVTLTPTGDGQTTELATVVPATAANANHDAITSDRWPLAWQSNKLYQIVYGLNAPNAAGETNPPDYVNFDMHPPTWEVIQESFISNQADRVGMPKQGAVQNYMTFYNSQIASKTTAPGYKTLRWRFRLGNNSGLLPNPNTGGVTLNYVKVNEVSFD